MNLLPDTHVLIWWIEGSSRLGPQTKEMMFRDGVTLWVSAVAVWEMAIKTARGRLQLEPPVEETIPLLLERGFLPLPITIQHALEVRALPLLHNDPFDRMLVAQARCEDLTLVTADPAIMAYDLRTIDATD